MRLFVALTFEDAFLDALTQYLHSCRRLGRGSWTRREQLHLTLEFLGELQDPVPAMVAMDAVTVPPFDLVTGQPGFFRREDGDIFWLGLEPSPPLLSLQRQLHTALSRQGLKLETRLFRPHLTLGRGVTLSQPPAPPQLAQFISGISLLESSRVDGALTYTEQYWRRLPEPGVDFPDSLICGDLI